MTSKITPLILMISLFDLTDPARAGNHVGPAGGEKAGRNHSISVDLASGCVFPVGWVEGPLDPDQTSSLPLPFNWSCGDYTITGDIIGTARRGPRSPGGISSGISANLVLTNFRVTRVGLQTVGTVTDVLRIIHRFPGIPSAEASAHYEGWYDNTLSNNIDIDSILDVRVNGVDSIFQMRPFTVGPQPPLYFNEIDGPTDPLGRVNDVEMELTFFLPDIFDEIILPDSAVVQVVGLGIPIPTLSFWGLVIVVFLLALAGSVILQSRSKSHKPGATQT